MKRFGIWQQLRAKGIELSNTWIDETETGASNFPELWRRIRAEIISCKALVLYVQDETDFPLKGALIEAGMALALGKPVVVITSGISIEGRTCRPFGSWILDRDVVLVKTMDEAIDVLKRRWLIPL